MGKHTPLYQQHVGCSAKIGSFAGYDMPLYYGLGVMKEHLWVRAHAGLFDVSHMGQVILKGAGVAAFLEKLTPSAFANKPIGRAQYTVLLNEEGGIIDDLIITRLADDAFFLVINAGCKDKDIAWITRHCPPEITLDYKDPQGLIALQGPQAAAVLQDKLGLDVADLGYMHMLQTQLDNGAPVLVSRLGYTGEDGFEISCAPDQAPALWDKLLSHPEVEPIGLAARDSLRLEMGYPLYGHDIDAQTSPVEAGLNWIISKTTQDYFGFTRIAQDKAEGTARQRVGIKLLDKGVAREGAEIQDAQGQPIGTLTSGGFAPSLECGIGMGYVSADHAQNGQSIFIHVRGRNIAAQIAAMPFLPPKTYKKS